MPLYTITEITISLGTTKPISWLTLFESSYSSIAEKFRINWRIITHSIEYAKIRKIRKAPWFLVPIQLSIQGQWWSNLSTHLSQIFQCLLLGVLITWHLGHSHPGSYLSARVMKSILSLLFQIARISKSRYSPKYNY